MGITGFQLKCSGALIKQEKARSVAESTSLLDGFLFGSQAQYWSHASDVVGSSFCRKLLNVFCSLIGRKKERHFLFFSFPAARLAAASRKMCVSYTSSSMLSSFSLLQNYSWEDICLFSTKVIRFFKFIHLKFKAVLSVSWVLKSLGS